MMTDIPFCFVSNTLRTTVKYSKRKENVDILQKHGLGWHRIASKSQ